LKAGERLLVHAAAGGVGMAAIQVARAIGAEVLATASRPKWDVVRSLGVEHVANSRDGSFVQAVRTATGGKGAHVVLNSLAREFVDWRLSLLSEGGRFIDMGMTDVRNAETVYATHRVNYRNFHLGEEDPGYERIAEIFAAVVEGFNSGQFQPL